MRVLEHGVNIEVEKPLCIDLVQADEVLAKAKKKNARVAVHHQTPHESINARSRESLRRRKNR